MKIYDLMFTGGLVLAILFFVVTVILFFLLNIPKAFGEVTGLTEKKAIKELRAGNAVGKRSHAAEIHARTIPAEKAAGKSRSVKEKEPVKTSARAESPAAGAAVHTEGTAGRRENTGSGVTPQPGNVNLQGQEPETEVLTYSEMNGTPGEEATDVLNETEEAAFFDNSADVLTEDGDAPTDVLTEDADAPTDVLTEEDGDAPTDVLTEDGDAPTDVLTGESESTGDLGKEDVYGTLQAGLTSVLRGDAPVTGSADEGTEEMTSDTSFGTEGGSAELQPVQYTGEKAAKIHVLYQVTVVHTDETL